jgi:hypothetical protein
MSSSASSSGGDAASGAPSSSSSNNNTHHHNHHSKRKQKGWSVGDFVSFLNTGFVPVAAHVRNPPYFVGRVLGDVQGHHHGPAGPLLKVS